MAIERFFIVGKDIEPFQTHIHIVEDKAAEQTVFSIGNERKYLARCTGKQCRQAMLGKFDKLNSLIFGCTSAIQTSLIAFGLHENSRSLRCV